MITRVGAWVDRSGVLDAERRLKNAVSLGLTDVSLVLHGQDRGRPFAPFVSASKAAGVASRYRDAGIAVSVMVWPRPSAVHGESVVQYLSEVVAAAPGVVSVVEGDLEEQWTRDGGARSRDSVGAVLATRVRELGVRWGVNGITAALPRLRSAAAQADVVIPQAYTSDKVGQSGVPGKRQSEVWAAWGKAFPGKERVMGLAAYGQTPAGLSAAWDASEACGAGRVQFWSLGQIVDVAWVTRFVRGKCEAARG